MLGLQLFRRHAHVGRAHSPPAPKIVIAADCIETVVGVGYRFIELK
jgi:hypothetical protein